MLARDDVRTPTAREPMMFGNASGTPIVDGADCASLTPTSDGANAERTPAGQPLTDAGQAPAGQPLIDVVVPVYNEQTALERSIRRLHRFLDLHLPFAWRIVIADNASTDATPQIAHALTQQLDGVRSIRLPVKGRGGALRAAWMDSDADVLCYMDVDLSTDLRAVLPLVAGLVSGHSAW